MGTAGVGGDMAGAMVVGSTVVVVVVPPTTVVVVVVEEEAGQTVTGSGSGTCTETLGTGAMVVVGGGVEYTTQVVVLDGEGRTPGVVAQPPPPPPMPPFPHPTTTPPTTPHLMGGLGTLPPLPLHPPLTVTTPTTEGGGVLVQLVGHQPTLTGVAVGEGRTMGCCIVGRMAPPLPLPSAEGW